MLVQLSFIPFFPVLINRAQLIYCASPVHALVSVACVHLCAFDLFLPCLPVLRVDLVFKRVCLHTFVHVSIHSRIICEFMLLSSRSSMWIISPTPNFFLPSWVQEEKVK